jgi:hypothetical protein
MTDTQTYRGKTIVRTWNGYKRGEPSGALHPETYGSIADAQKSIDFDISKGIQ